MFADRTDDSRRAVPRQHAPTAPRLRVVASLRSKLLALSVVALAPGFLALAWTQTEVARLRRAEIRDQTAAAALTAATELERITSGVQAVLTTLFHAPGIRAMETARCNAFLQALKPDLPHLATINVHDETGAFRCGSRAEPQSANARNLLKSALWRPGPQVGGYSIDPTSGRPILPIALAMRNPGQPAFGVIVAELDVDWLGRAIEARGIPAGASLTVADSGGVIVASSPAPSSDVGQLLSGRHQALLKAQAPGVEDAPARDGARRILAFVPGDSSSHGLYVAAALSWRANQDVVAQARWTGAMLAVAAALATLGATWVAGDWLFVRPLRRVTLLLRRWRAGDTSARTFYSPVMGEIGQLGAELDRMMDQIARADSERDLLSRELVHRVKNTLATVSSIASASMNRDAPARELLPDFTSRIAALARTHDILTARHWRDASLTTLLRAELEPLAPDQARRVTLEGPPVLLPARDASGLVMIVHELCTNALKYGALSTSDGQVEIAWSVRVEAPTALVLQWRERNGPPVKTPDRTRLGFGARLIARALGDSGTAVLNFDPAGIVCRIDIGLAPLPAAAGAPL